MATDVNKLAYLKALEEKAAHMESLPHLYRDKHYKWSRLFFESRQRRIFLTAANQIGKSSVNIKKCIEWATNKELWPHLWPGREPNQFWYMYPSSKVSTVEFATKWSLYLPKDKKHPTYGWSVTFKSNSVESIKFNSGMHVFFKYYSQNVMNLQAATVYAVFCDEELPEEHYDEINMRLAATQGYFHMVFTATLGQDIWRRTMEPTNPEEELFPDALKIQVSMYDCLTFEDGSPSHWTPKIIAGYEKTCKSHAEAMKRVHGRFVLDSGRLYHAFDAEKHMIEKHPISDSWSWYVGVDMGSGKRARGGSSQGAPEHPSAVVFVAVHPDMTEARVAWCWRGDNINTIAGDVFDLYTHTKDALGITPTQKVYDPAAPDFGSISVRKGDAFMPADKNREKGFLALNNLFSQGKLLIFKNPESAKLAVELNSLTVNYDKRRVKDDLCDALRYVVNSIPFNWGGMAEERPPVPQQANMEVYGDEDKRQRRFYRGSRSERGQEAWSVSEELDFWADLLGTR